MKRVILLLVVMVAAAAVTWATDFGFYCGGVWVTSNNYKSIKTTSKYITGDGTVTFNPTTNTLTITDCTITRTGSDNRAVHNKSCQGLKVVLAGTNVFNCADAAPIKYETSGEITVQSGTTTLTGAKGGIAIQGSDDLKILGPGKLVINSTGDPAIERFNNTLGELTFDNNIHAELWGKKGDIVGCRTTTFFDCDVTLKSTFDTSYPVLSNVTVCNIQNSKILKPEGAHFDVAKKMLVDKNGEPLVAEALISNNYIKISDTSNFPDAKFREYLASRTYGADDALTPEEIASITRLDINDKSIANLKGIEFFTELQILNARGNLLADLDVSKNTKLQQLNVDDNRLTAITLGSAPATLQYFHCSGNRLTTLNLSGCTSITEVVCQSNKLSTISMPPSTRTLTFNCSNNELTSLDLSPALTLWSLDCSGNKLTTLDASQCTNLRTLYIQRNNITGDGMTALVNKLPARTATTFGMLYALDNSNSWSDGNDMTRAQYLTAADKYWQVYTYTNSEWNPFNAGIYGDVNDDGEVNVGDVNYVLNIVLSESYDSNADINNDGTVNVGDVNIILNLILAK